LKELKEKFHAYPWIVELFEDSNAIHLRESISFSNLITWLKMYLLTYSTLAARD